MKYILRSRYLDDEHEETIDADCFNLIRHSREVLTAAFEIEDIFDNLISNYIEVETRCLEVTASRLARRTVGYREGNETLAAINLVFVNYLSTARAYVDKIGPSASRCFEGSESQLAKDKVKNALAEQHDAAFGYRFMEALRNHVQHSGSALHTLSQGYRKLKDDDRSETVIESFLEPLCNKTALAERGSFKAQVLKECPDVINLLECARVHVRGLSYVHRALRTLTSQVIADATLHIKAGQALIENKVSGGPDSVEAISIKPDDEETVSVQMHLQWEDVRKWLVQRNPGVADGFRKYPSGRGADL